MNQSLKLYLILLLSTLSLNACSVNLISQEADIYHQWRLEKVIYDDGSVNHLEDGNFVKITESEVIELIRGHGKRSYKMSRNGDNLMLTMGDNGIEWRIFNLNENLLQIHTPIGAYYLVR